MPHNERPWQDLTKRYFAPLITGAPAMAFIPAFCLAAFWFGGEGALMVMAAMLPVVYLAAGHFYGQNRVRQTSPKAILSRDLFSEKSNIALEHATQQGTHSAIFMVELDDINALIGRHGPSAADAIAKRTAEQILQVLRTKDHVGRLGDAKFGICISPVHHLDLELCIQLAGRLQTMIEEPISIDGIAVYVTASIGFCQLSRAPGSSATEWIEAASAALCDAQSRGPTAIRAYSPQMPHRANYRNPLCDDVSEALELGQFQPWFQPQISTETGEITGLEALARWSHPTRGTVSPADFLPAIEEANLLERLAEVMMYHSFAALKAWDSAGVIIPQVGVNFAGSELCNPQLTEKIEWELDRFDLTPDRLAVEVLETVVSSAPDDIITRNINALGNLGCRIDLDDFGTGHASISSIRRFSVSRIKIDRSFVTRADRDPEQQRMISAILTMAERLGIETLAEGVETVGEHVLLAQLGCNHVQGFGIARPMPFEQTLDWVTRHQSKLTEAPRFIDGKRT
jgi:diguanylate cyclase (GGDEF)-like protein